MDTKDFVDNSDISVVESFLTTLKLLYNSNQTQVRDIEYWLKIRREREVKAEADRLALQLVQEFAHSYKNTRVTLEGEVECFYDDVVFTVKVISKRPRGDFASLSAKKPFKV